MHEVSSTSRSTTPREAGRRELGEPRRARACCGRSNGSAASALGRAVVVCEGLAAQCRSAPGPALRRSNSDARISSMGRLCRECAPRSGPAIPRPHRPAVVVAADLVAREPRRVLERRRELEDGCVLAERLREVDDQGPAARREESVRPRRGGGSRHVDRSTQLTPCGSPELVIGAPNDRVRPRTCPRNRACATSGVTRAVTRALGVT